jgi:hypothetical protein
MFSTALQPVQLLKVAVKRGTSFLIASAFVLAALFLAAQVGSRAWAGAGSEVEVSAASLLSLDTPISAAQVASRALPAREPEAPASEPDDATVSLNQWRFTSAAGATLAAQQILFLFQSYALTQFAVAQDYFAIANSGQNPAIIQAQLNALVMFDNLLTFLYTQAVLYWENVYLTNLIQPPASPTH